jgi:hypothetical protein
MIAKAFHRVGYPILPRIDAELRDGQVETDPDRGPLTMQHYSQTLPRDFDLSPNFEVIKIGAFDAERRSAARPQSRREGVGEPAPAARVGPEANGRPPNR